MDWSETEIEIEGALTGEAFEWWLRLQAALRQFFGNIPEGWRIFNIHCARAADAFQRLGDALRAGLPDGWTIEEAAAYEEIVEHFDA